jgi:hypothetical protein
MKILRLTAMVMFVSLTGLTATFVTAASDSSKQREIPTVSWESHAWDTQSAISVSEISTYWSETTEATYTFSVPSAFSGSGFQSYYSWGDQAVTVVAPPLETFIVKSPPSVPISLKTVLSDSNGDLVKNILIPIAVGGALVDTPFYRLQHSLTRSDVSRGYGRIVPYSPAILLIVFLLVALHLPGSFGPGGLSTCTPARRGIPGTSTCTVKRSVIHVYKRPQTVLG